MPDAADGAHNRITKPRAHASMPAWVLLASPEGKAMVEEGLKFPTEELQAAFSQVLVEADADQRMVTTVHRAFPSRNRALNPARSP